MVRFAWYWIHSYTFTLRKDTPQNCLWNSWAIVEVSELVFRVFCLMLIICSVTYYVPFGMILISFRYLHALWGCSTKPFMKWWSHCGGKWTCIRRHTFHSLVLWFNVAYSTQENWASGQKTMGLKLQITRRVGRWGITIPWKALFSLLCPSIWSCSYSESNLDSCLKTPSSEMILIASLPTPSLILGLGQLALVQWNWYWGCIAPHTW